MKLSSSGQPFVLAMDQSPPSVPAPGRLARCMTIQGPGSKRGSFSTVNELQFHRPLTPQNSLASCSSTLFRSSIASSLRSSYTSSIDDSIPPWWEAQAEYILRGHDLQAIRLLCRYRTYRDSSTPASILRTRWTPILNNSLLQLSAGTSSRSHVDDMDLDQKVKEILTRLEPSRPDDRTWWHSTLPAALSQPDASNVASELNEESLSRFESITFLDYVREALYPNEDVLPLEAFKDWHDDLFNQISDRLENFPGETEKFVQVVRVSAAVPIPFARLMILMAAIARRKPGALGGQPKCVVCAASSFGHGTCASTQS